MFFAFIFREICQRRLFDRFLVPYKMICFFIYFLVLRNFELKNLEFVLFFLDQK